MKIFFDEKPTPEVIAALKKSVYKWAPSIKAWQRKIGDGAWWNLRSTLPKILAFEDPNKIDEYVRAFFKNYKPKK